MKTLDEFALTPVERRYQQALDRMTGMEKMRRTAALCQSGWEMVALQVREQYGDAISEREFRFRVAERMYMGDPAFLALLRRAYERGAPPE